jgi:predicted TIM-barrel fold metal-dependent hydrolase
MRLMNAPYPHPVVDAHHHLWRRADLAWLDGPPVPRIFGAYEPIRRDYLAAEFQADCTPSGVTRSVYVQTNWPAGGELEEVRWVQSIAEQSGFPHAIVAGANLADPNVADLLDAQMKSPLLRGVRQQLHWHTNPQYCFATRPDWVRDPAWRRGLAEVRDRGLVFELQVFPSQMQDAADLAQAFPDLQIVLLHAGMLTDREPPTLAAWRSGVQALAACPNVSTKLSALSTFSRQCTVDIWQPIVSEAITWFGADRCMFGSNFPVEKLWTDYRSLFDVFRQCVNDRPLAEQRAILHDTACRIYRLPPDTPRA